MILHLLILGLVDSVKNNLLKTSATAVLCFLCVPIPLISLWSPNETLIYQLESPNQRNFICCHGSKWHRQNNLGKTCTFLDFQALDFLCLQPLESLEQESRTVLIITFLPLPNSQKRIDNGDFLEWANVYGNFTEHLKLQSVKPLRKEKAFFSTLTIKAQNRSVRMPCIPFQYSSFLQT